MALATQNPFAHDRRYLFAWLVEQWEASIEFASQIRLLREKIEAVFKKAADSPSRFHRFFRTDETTETGVMKTLVLML